MPPRTQLAIEVLSRHDPEFQQLVDTLYPGADPDEIWYEVFGKSMPDPSALHVPTAGKPTRKHRLLEAAGIGATAVGLGTAIPELGRSIDEAKGVESTASKAPQVLQNLKAAHPKGYAQAKVGAIGAMFAGDAAAEQQQISASKKKAVPTGAVTPVTPVVKGAAHDIAATFVDSMSRSAGALRRGARDAAPKVEAEAKNAEDGSAAAPVKVPLVSGNKSYQAGKFVGTKSGKKAIATGGAGALLLGHHERNVGANQAYDAQYEKRDAEFRGTFSKLDPYKRQVFGFAGVVQKDGHAVTDRQGDVIDPEEMESAAYDFVLNSRVGGSMHKRDAFDQPHHVSDLIESFAVTPEKLQALGIPAEIAKSVPVGWWTGFKVWDDDAWQDVLDGKLTGFSIHGKGKRVPIPDEEAFA
jgi:hypothetical protein